MQIEGKNYYKVVWKNSLNTDSFEALSVLYVPFIGSKGVGFYMTLAAEASFNNQFTQFRRLNILLDMSSDEIAEMIDKLQDYLLLRVLCKEDRYLLQLCPPLTFTQFFKHDVFARAYFSKVGTKEYENTKDKYLEKQTNYHEYEDITKPFNIDVLNSWDDKEEEKFLKRKVEKNDEENGIPVNFDYDKFLTNYSYLVFPQVLRTKENLRRIGEIATIYGIDEETMQKFVGKATDYSSNSIDFDYITGKAVGEKKINIENLNAGKNKYDMPPVNFLHYLQNNIPVSTSDKRVLASLQTDYHLPRDVINFMVESLMKENKLTKNYMEKIAANWAMEKVDTLAKAKEKVAEGLSKRKGRNAVPEHSTSEEVKTKDVDMDELYAKMFGKDK